VNTLVAGDQLPLPVQAASGGGGRGRADFADARAIAAAARESGIELIPLVNLLAAPVVAKTTFGLLRRTRSSMKPGLYKDNARHLLRQFIVSLPPAVARGGVRRDRRDPGPFQAKALPAAWTRCS